MLLYGYFNLGRYSCLLINNTLYWCTPDAHQLGPYCDSNLMPQIKANQIFCGYALKASHQDLSNEHQNKHFCRN